MAEDIASPRMSVAYWNNYDWLEGTATFTPVQPRRKLSSKRSLAAGMPVYSDAIGASGAGTPLKRKPLSNVSLNLCTPTSAKLGSQKRPTPLTPSSKEMHTLAPRTPGKHVSDKENSHPNRASNSKNAIPSRKSTDSSVKKRKREKDCEDDETRLLFSRRLDFQVCAAHPIHSLETGEKDHPLIQAILHFMTPCCGRYCTSES
jgi:hypothetical protein